MKRILQLVFVFLVLGNISLAQDQFIKHYTVAEGLPTNKIYCVCQDSKGFMWFGTDAGVIRFDGKTFVHFTMDDGLSDNEVKKIKEDNIGRLWFLNRNGWVNFYYLNIIYNERNAPFLNDLHTNFYLYDFYQDEDSTIYFYNSASEVLVFKNNQLVDYRDFGVDIKAYNLLYLNKTSDGKFLLWSNPGIYEFENLDDSLILHPFSLFFQRVFPKNRYETFGLDRFGYISSYYNAEISEKQILKSETQYFYSVVTDKDGFIWLATEKDGVYCYKNGKVVKHLEIEKATDLIADKENSIWVTSYNSGIYRINRDILKFQYFKKEVFDNKGINGLAPANTGGVWATNGNAIFLIKGNEAFPIPLKIEKVFLENIYQLKNNTLLSNGVSVSPFFIEKVRFNPVNNSFKYSRSGYFGYRLNKLAIDKKEQFIYSYMNNLLMIIQPKNNYRAAYYPVGTELINNVFFNRRNELIINASKNYLFSGNNISKKKELKLFDGEVIRSHLTLDTLNELFNINGEYVYLQNNQTLYNLTEKFKTQIDFQIKDIVYTGSTLFFSTSKTVYYIFNPLKVISGDSLELNKLNIEFNNINDIICQDSILYVASDDGLTTIAIKECGINPFLPAKPYFGNILLNDKKIDYSSGKIDFRGHKKISIEYASVSYSTLPIKYRYRLEGYDKNWTQSNETNVVYQNLPPGFYTFKLQSRKINEDYGKAIEFSLNVRPTFFQRKITWIVIILIFLSFVISQILNYKNRQLKQKETESQLLSLENKALQSMMNPHFIFNSLGSIQSYLLQNKAVEAGTYLSQFARLIRQNMNSLKSNFISIEDEVERLRNYIELEKFRMEAKFDFTIEVDDQLDSDEICIPSMIVQPFAENAIWHGISSLPGNGSINIRFEKRDEKSICIFIEDNGIGITKTREFSKSGQHLNMGIGLIEKRIKLIGERFKVKSEIITEELYPGLPNPGTRVIIIAPISNGEYRI